jgi:hypothetical protein
MEGPEKANKPKQSSGAKILLTLKFCRIDLKNGIENQDDFINAH